jgi:D-3-phosphoglycerate dehydrogenase
MLGLVPGVEVVVTEMAPLTARVIAAAEALRLIVVCRGGPVNVNLDAATARGIPVCFTPARNAAATAEYTIGLILAAMRHIAAGHSDLLAGQWRGDFYAYDLAGSELEGKTAGLVGFGAIGRRVASILRAFGAHVLIADPYVDTDDVAAVGAELVTLAELLPRADILSLHARLTPETRHLIGRPEIARLPRGAVVVNAARGGLLDQDALCDALESGQLRAAALDVYDPEPPPPASRLFTTPNLVLSPHLAGASRETAERAARIAAAEIGRYLRGEPLRFVANPAAAAATAGR